MWLQQPSSASWRPSTNSSKVTSAAWKQFTKPFWQGSSRKPSSTTPTSTLPSYVCYTSVGAHQTALRLQNSNILRIGSSPPFQPPPPLLQAGIAATSLNCCCGWTTTMHSLGLYNRLRRTSIYAFLVGWCFVYNIGVGNFVMYWLGSV